MGGHSRAHPGGTSGALTGSFSASGSQQTGAFQIVFAPRAANTLLATAPSLRGKGVRIRMSSSPATGCPGVSATFCGAGSAIGATSATRRRLGGGCPCSFELPFSPGPFFTRRGASRHRRCQSRHPLSSDRGPRASGCGREGRGGREDRGAAQVKRQLIIRERDEVPRVVGRGGCRHRGAGRLWARFWSIRSSVSSHLLAESPFFRFLFFL